MQKEIRCFLLGFGDIFAGQGIDEGFSVILLLFWISQRLNRAKAIDYVSGFAKVNFIQCVPRKNKKKMFGFVQELHIKTKAQCYFKPWTILYFYGSFKNAVLKGH